MVPSDGMMGGLERRPDMGDRSTPPEPLSPETVAANRVKATNNVLPVLVHRAGGSVTVTREDFEAFQSLYGSGAKLRMEQLDDGSGIRLTLVRAPMSQGDAVM